MNTRKFPPFRSGRSLIVAAAMAVVLAHLTAPTAFAATFYWDNNNTTAGFGTAGAGGATWAQNSTSPATGSNSARWKTDANGVLSGSATQATNSAVHNFNFGTTANGLGAGAITVSGTVLMGDTTYGSASGEIVLQGGVISFYDGKTITVNNTANTINSVVGGATDSLTKAGAGKLTFGGANTYTGATIIDGGTLALASTGSIDNTSGVQLGGGTFDVSAKSGGYTVNNLSGSGTVLGALTVSTGLAIGPSPGPIDFDALTLGGASVYTHQLTGGDVTAGLVTVSGTLTIDLGAMLDLDQLGTYTVGDKFTLFAYLTGELTGTFAGLADGDVFNDAGGQWQIDYDDTSAGLNGGTGTSFVTITAVPEPSAVLLGCFGSVLLLRRRRLAA